MQIETNEIHIWSADLAISEAQLSDKFALLSPDEIKRANRFRFPIHKQRFIAARSMLRNLIGLYTGVLPEEIIFSYDPNGKPFLQFPDLTRIKFNLSHSDDVAVYAFTLDHPIGIDIEKIESGYNAEVTERFFTPQENAALLNLPPEERPAGFYRIWSRKEAVIKAVGKGLAIPLSSFSVSVNDDFETVMIDNNERWSLLPVFLQSAYQSAVATNQIVKKVCYWKLIDQSPKLEMELSPP
jgi:4'-phosphopantetheinyl transferase